MSISLEEARLMIHKQCAVNRELSISDRSVPFSVMLRQVSRRSIDGELSIPAVTLFNDKLVVRFSDRSDLLLDLLAC